MPEVAVAVVDGEGVASKLDKGSEGGEDVVWEATVALLRLLVQSGMRQVIGNGGAAPRLNAPTASTNSNQETRGYGRLSRRERGVVRVWWCAQGGFL
jgi:hypothetical protein